MKLRSYIRAPRGKILLAFDLSQAESWIVAFSSGDPNMKQSLMFGDIHTDTAQFIMDVTRPISKEERYSNGKKPNHAFSYRMTANRYLQVYNKEANDLGMPPIDMRWATHQRERWLLRYECVPNKWWPEIEQALNSRVLVTTYGRSRMFFQGWGQELFKEATAFIPQSTVADHANGAVHPQLGIEGGLLPIWKLWHERCKFINQSHDSFIVEIDPSMKDDFVADALRYYRRPLVINDEMFTIPIDAEEGERWGELSKLTLPKAA